MSLIDAAAFLSEHYPVFPCLLNKRPATEHGFKDAVSDPTEARRLFRTAGAAMIGVPTGEASGLAVIDLDVKEGRFGLEWLAANEHRMPRTRRHRTQSGGLHLLFAYPAGRNIRNSASKISPGVDVRGNGGYIIAPPSPGYSIEDDTMPSPMPGWLVELLDPPKVDRVAPTPGPRATIYANDGTPYGLAALTRECEAIRNAGEGQKHATLNRGAYSIGGLVAAGEVIEGAAYAALSDALASIRHRCDDFPAAERTLQQGFRDGMASPRQPPPREVRHTIRIEVAEPEMIPWDRTPDGPGYDDQPYPDHTEAYDPETGVIATPAKPAVPAIWSDDDEWEEIEIAPRPWIAKGYLMRKAVTVLSGPGGGGKSNLSVGWSTALATAGSLGAFAGAEMGLCYRQLVYNTEDDRDEQRRRYSAALRAQNLTTSAIRGMVSRCGPTDIGTLIVLDQATGNFLFTEAWDALEQRIIDFRPDVVWLDPLVELHTAEENDNTALRQVVARLRSLATRHNCAVVLVHHARKGSTAGDPEGIRGAGSIVGASRISLTVMPMTAEEAEEMQIPADQRDLFFRVDGAKANYSRRGLANWHTMQEHELANGDLVAAVVAWTPDARSTASRLDPDRMALIEAAVRRGTSHGPYSARLSHAEPRSLLPLLLSHGFESKHQQAQVITALVKAGFTTHDFRGPNRSTKQGFRSPEGLPEGPWVVNATEAVSK
jgi:hypothetical protein